MSASVSCQDLIQPGLSTDVVNMLDSMQQSAIIAAKHSSSDSFEDLGELRRAFIQRHVLVLVGVSNSIDVRGQVTEEETVIGIVHMFSDLDIGSVDAVQVAISD